jgi:hypothetical protein
LLFISSTSRVDGVKCALLAVSIIDTLRTCGLAETDWNDPGAVLRSLNRL